MDSSRHTPRTSVSAQVPEDEPRLRSDCLLDPHRTSAHTYPSPGRGHRSHSRFRRIGVALTLILAATAGWGYWQTHSKSTAGAQEASTTTTGPVSEIRAAERGEALELTGTTLTDETVDLRSLRGNVVVVNLWGSWCAPCRQEAPVLAEQSKLFADQAVRFIGVDVQDNRPAALAFERRYGISYPSIEDTDGRALLALAKHVPARAVPVTLILDGQGRVAGRIVGILDASTLSGLIASAGDGNLGSGNDGRKSPAPVSPLLVSPLPASGTS